MAIILFCIINRDPALMRRCNRYTFEMYRDIYMRCYLFPIALSQYITVLMKLLGVGLRVMSLRCRTTGYILSVYILKQPSSARKITKHSNVYIHRISQLSIMRIRTHYILQKSLVQIPFFRMNIFKLVKKQNFPIHNERKVYILLSPRCITHERSVIYKVVLSEKNICYISSLVKSANLYIYTHRDPSPCRVSYAPSRR